MNDGDKDMEREQTAGTGAASTHGRVLFMDDKEYVRSAICEEYVRSAICEVLVELGYEVESAVEGGQAVALYEQARKAGTPFDVVILDVTVERGMGGREAIERLLEIEPEVRIIVSSGFPHDPVVMDYRSFGARAAIIKPYNSSQLDEVIKRVLRG